MIGRYIVAASQVLSPVLCAPIVFDPAAHGATRIIAALWTVIATIVNTAIVADYDGGYK